jgi:hypothetical protein
MAKFYEPDMGQDPENPFARDADGKLVRRSYWLDMGDRSIILMMAQGLGSVLSNEQKRMHLEDIGRGHLTGDICTVEILPPEQ